MKKLLSISLVIVLLLSGLFVFTGCEKEEETKKKDEKKTDLSAVAGTYAGQYTKLVGSTTKEDDEEFSLELKEDGSGVHNRNNATYKVKWSLNGEKFKMTETFLGSSIEYTGTLKNDKLDIFNGDPDDKWTYEYVYKKGAVKENKENKTSVTGKTNTTDSTNTTDNTKTSIQLPTNTDTKKDDSSNNTQSTNNNEIRSEFKEAMDSYEAFVDDYVAFMKKYKASNGTDTSLMSDYSTYMSKYNEVSQKIQKWNADSLNEAELNYYTQVISRVSQKIQNALK